MTRKSTSIVPTMKNAPYAVALRLKLAKTKTTPPYALAVLALSNIQRSINLQMYKEDIKLALKWH
jgi:hypothetical protein